MTHTTHHYACDCREEAFREAVSIVEELSYNHPLDAPVDRAVQFFEKYPWLISTPPEEGLLNE